MSAIGRTCLLRREKPQLIAAPLDFPVADAQTGQN